MKYLPVLLISLLWMASACASPSAEEPPTANEILAAKHAREDAERAIAAPEGSMQREGAILHIKATQEKILQLGDTSAAIAYGDTASALLYRAGLIY